MRIGTYNMLSQIYGTSSGKKTNQANGTGTASFRDEVSLSSKGKDMQVAKNALAATPDVRESKVNDLKNQIANGTYEVSDEAFADKLLSAFDSRKAF